MTMEVPLPAKILGLVNGPAIAVLRGFTKKVRRVRVYAISADTSMVVPDELTYIGAQKVTGPPPQTLFYFAGVVQ